VSVTPYEPEWEGFVTLGNCVTTHLPAKVCANEELCQILFLRPEDAREVSYSDRKGKFWKRQEVTLSKLQG